MFQEVRRPSRQSSGPGLWLRPVRNVVALLLLVGLVWPTPRATTAPLHTGQLEVIGPDNVERLGEQGRLGPGLVRAVAYSPDGQYLALGSVLGVYLYNPVLSVGRLLEQAAVESLDFAPDGQTLAAGTREGTIRLWRAADWAPLLDLEGHTRAVTSVAFGPDGEMLATGSDDGSVRLWRVADGALVRVMAEGLTPVTSVAFTPDGELLGATAPYAARPLQLWRVADGAPFPTPMTSRGLAERLAFSADGQTIAVVLNSDVQLRHLADGTLPRALDGGPRQGFPERLLSIAFAPDGQTLASGSDGGRVQIWRVADGALLSTIAGHHDAVHSVAFAPDGQQLVSASADGAVQVWQAADGQLVGSLADQLDWVHEVAFSPDGQTLAAALEGELVRLWRMPDQLPLGELGGYGGTSPAEARFSYRRGRARVAFGPDGQTLASGVGYDLKLWRVADQAALWATRAHRFTGLNGLAFAPDGRTLASALEDVKLWQVLDGTLVRTLAVPGGQSPAPSPASQVGALASELASPVVPGREVLSIAFSPNGELLAAGSNDGAVHLWQVGDGTLLATLVGHTKSVQSVAFSPRGETLATASADATVRLWRVLDATPVSVFTGDAGWMHSVAFSPDGRILASGAADGTIRLWHAGDGAPLRSLEGHRGVVTSLAFAPDGRLLVSGSKDGTVRLWGAVAADPACPDC